MKKQVPFWANPLDDAGEWSGILIHPEMPQDRYNIILARPDPPLSAILSHSVAPWGAIIDGYYDASQAATLLNCRAISYSNFGGAGSNYIRSRQSYSGTSDCLIIGAHRGFKAASMEIKHPALDSLLWTYLEQGDENQPPREILSFCIDKFTTVRLSEYTSEKTDIVSRITLRRPYLVLEFANDISLVQCYHVYTVLCALLSLLTGIRYNPEGAKLRRRGAKPLESASLDYRGGVTHRERPLTVSFTTMDAHRFAGVICNFFRCQEFLWHEIETLDRNYFDAPYAEDTLYWLLPILERQVRRRFTFSEEEEFLSLRTEFFEFIDRETGGRLRDFSRKHLKIVKDKSPGLKQCLQRAVAFFAKRGAEFEELYPANAVGVRSHLMHGNFDAESFPRPLSEIHAQVVKMIFLIIYTELGLASENYGGLIQASSTENG